MAGPLINDKLKQPKQQGTGFTNIQKVVSANQNNRLGQNIGRTISTIGKQAGTRLGEAGQKFQEKVGQSETQIDAGQKLSNEIGKTNFDKGENLSNLSNLGTDVNANTVKTLGAGYQGPSGLQNAEGLQAQAQNASQLGRMAGSDTGRQGLLRRFAGGNQYTQGQQQLDSMLLGKNLGQVNQAKRQVQGLGQQAMTQAQAAEQRAAAARGQFGDVNKNLRDLLERQSGDLTSTIDKRIGEYGTKSSESANALVQRIRDGEVSPEDINRIQKEVLGGSEDVYNLKPKDLASLVEAQTGFNRSNVVKRDEIAARDALAKLSGKATGDELLDLDEQAQALSVDPRFNLASFTPGYQDAANRAKQTRENFKAKSIDRGIDLTNPWAGSMDVNYEQASQLAPLVEEFRKNPTPEGYAKLQQTGQQLGLFSPNRYSLSDVARGDNIDSIINTYFGSVIDPYNQVTREQGIGNKLRDLLQTPKNKTFNVT